MRASLGPWMKPVGGVVGLVLQGARYSKGKGAVVVGRCCGVVVVTARARASSWLVVGAGYVIQQGGGDGWIRANENGPAGRRAKKRRRDPRPMAPTERIVIWAERRLVPSGARRVTDVHVAVSTGHRSSEMLEEGSKGRAGGWGDSGGGVSVGGWVGGGLCMY